MFTICFMLMLRFDSQELHIDDIMKIKKSKDGINDNYKDNWYKITDSNIKRLHSLVRIWCKYPKSLVLRIAITIDRKQLQSERSIKISRKKKPSNYHWFWKSIYKNMEMYENIVKSLRIDKLHRMGSFGSCRICPGPN